MANLSGRVHEWIRRYLIAELAGLTAALFAAILAASWSPDRLAVVAYAGSLGETVGFYAGFLISQYRGADPAGSRRRRAAAVLALTVVEFGPAELADTLLVRPAAMFLGSLATGNVLVGVLIGKVAADLAFYGLAITSYEFVVRRWMLRFRRPAPGGEPERTPDVPSGPSLVMDLDVVTEHYRRFTEALPGVAVHFAVKCNPDVPLLRHLFQQGAQFDVASYPELATLIRLGVQPGDVIFSNPVKPWWHVRDAYADGVYRFAVDSEAELAKLARFAPGAALLVRLAVAPAASDVPSEGKFGVDAEAARRLLLAAVDAGLRPWGLTFHVGSQMTNPSAWVAPIQAAATIMRHLERSGIRLAVLDIGGGFPADYGQPVPPIEEYGECIRAALSSLPYPVDVLAEPGRGLVADAGRLETTCTRRRRYFASRLMSQAAQQFGWQPPTVQGLVGESSPNGGPVTHEVDCDQLGGSGISS